VISPKVQVALGCTPPCAGLASVWEIEKENADLLSLGSILSTDMQWSLAELIKSQYNNK